MCVVLFRTPLQGAARSNKSDCTNIFSSIRWVCSYMSSCIVFPLRRSDPQATVVRTWKDICVNITGNAVSTGCILADIIPLLCFIHYQWSAWIISTLVDHWQATLYVAHKPTTPLSMDLANNNLLPYSARKDASNHVGNLYTRRMMSFRRRLD